MKNIFKMSLAVCSLVLASGCTDYRDIPVGKVGKVVDNSGVSKETYQPGTRNIGWEMRYTKKLVLLDSTVETIPLELSVRLDDNQELNVQVLVKLRLDMTDDKTVDSMFTMVTPIKIDKNNLNIPLTLIYSKLGQDLVRRSLVEIITPNSLESFQRDRKLINDVIEQTIRERFDTTPLVLLSATINRVTYPRTYINKANDIKNMEMNIELKASEEKAKRARLEEEEATVAIEQRVRLAKAETVRLENLKTIEGLNPMLLEYRKLELEEARIEVDRIMATAAAKGNNKIIYYPMGQKPEYIDTSMGLQGK